MFRISPRSFALCIPLLFCCVQGLAQTPDIGVVRAAPEPVSVNNTLTYTISLTNTHNFTVTDLNVFDTLPSSAVLLSASSVPAANISTNGNTVTFQFVFGLAAGSNATMTITVRPTAVGNATNTVVVSEFGLPNEPTTLVSTVVPESADLSVILNVPSSPVLQNESVGYTVTVTNRGPGAAPGVVLANTFSSNVFLRGLSPSNGVTFTGSSLSINVGSLANGSAATYQVSIQPPNPGSLTISANASSSAVADPTSSNNTTSAILNVTAPFGDLEATFTSDQEFNPQTGLMQQIVTLSNNGTSSVPAARVVVAGLTPPDRLFNAVGTNNGNPYVLYNATLAPTQSVNLVLEYYIRMRAPVEGLTLAALGVPVVTLTTTATSGTNISLVKFLNDPPRVLIEFPSMRGTNYRILYSDDAAFTNPRVAQPDVTAPANRVQWIDYGPPKTISPVTNETRFYRVIIP